MPRDVVDNDRDVRGNGIEFAGKRMSAFLKGVLVVPHTDGNAVWTDALSLNPVAHQVEKLRNVACAAELDVGEGLCGHREVAMRVNETREDGCTVKVNEFCLGRNGLCVF